MQNFSSSTAWNMWEYRFSMTRILQYKKNTSQWKPLFSHILCSVEYKFPSEKCYL